MAATYFTLYYILPGLFKRNKWKISIGILVISIFIFALIHRILIHKIIWYKLELFYPAQTGILSYQLLHSIGQVYSVVIVAV
ncbi:MAG: hypothetical protein JSV24_01615, partial [Bacteroidales bacterium]